VEHYGLFNFSHATTLGALYRPLVPHMLLISMNCMVMKAFKGTVNLKPLLPGLKLKFKLNVTEGLRVSYFVI
jgi:hypothetical protein